MKQTGFLKLNLPEGTDGVDITKFNDNFTNLDEVLRNIGAGELKQLSNVGITTIQTPGIYLVYNLTDAPDIPPKENRYYLVKCYKLNTSSVTYHHEVYSIGTGKLYTRVWGNGYEDIPCTSPYQPRELYIDSINGSDDNSGSKESPVKTWDCAYSRIPKLLTKPLEIHLINAPSESYFELSGLSTFVPSTTWTWLTIYGHNTLINNLNILNCKFGASQWGIELKNMNINVTLGIVESCTVHIVSSKIRNIRVDNSVALCSYNTVSQYSAEDRAFIQLNGHKEHSIKASFGCFSTNGSLIYVNGIHPHGDVSEKYESFGGKVEYEN